MANIAFKGFLIPFTPKGARIIWDHQLYIFHSLGVTIFFFGWCDFHELYCVLPNAEKYSKPQCRLQKWKSKLSRSDITTFPGPLSAMCCV